MQKNTRFNDESGGSNCVVCSKCKKSPYITFNGDIRANFNYLKIAHFTEYISEEIPQKPCVYASFVLGQVSTPFFGALKFEFCISENVNKIIVLLSKMRDLQGFEHKKRPCRFYSTRSIFLLWFYNLGLPQIIEQSTLQG